MMHLTRYVNHHRELNNIYISHIYFFPSRKFNEIVPVVYIRYRPDLQVWCASKI